MDLKLTEIQAEELVLFLSGGDKGEHTDCPPDKYREGKCREDGNCYKCRLKALKKAGFVEKTGLEKDIEEWDSIVEKFQKFNDTLGGWKVKDLVVPLNLAMRIIGELRKK